MPITRDTHRLTTKTVIIFIFVGIIALGFVWRVERKFEMLEFAIMNPHNAIKTYHFLANNKDEVQIVIAGDSRAERQLIPKQMKNLTGLETANIACSGCDIVRMLDFLQPLKALNKHRIYLFSASSFQINDGAVDTGYLSLSMLRRMNLWERLKIFGGLFYLRTNEALNFYYTKEGFLQTLSESKLDENVRANLGFYPSEDNNPSCANIQLGKFSTNHPWYKDWNSNGARWRILREAIDQYALQDDFFIFFNPPTSKIWLDCTKGTFIEKAEREYAQKMSEYISRHPNMRFIDLYDRAELTLDHDYADIQHLNTRGARKLTNFFAQEVNKRGRLHERDSQKTN